MATVTVDFTVEASDGITSYWIRVSGEDVDLHDGEGSIDLEGSKNYRLVWWMTGAEGEHISISGKVGSDEIVGVGKSKVTDDGDGAGNKAFST